MTDIPGWIAATSVEAERSYRRRRQRGATHVVRKTALPPGSSCSVSALVHLSADRTMTAGRHLSRVAVPLQRPPQPCHPNGAIAPGVCCEALARPGARIRDWEALAMTRCPWCGRQFTARHGGREQRFCGPCCRRAYHDAARAWALAELAAGRLTVDTIRHPVPATRALPVRPSEQASLPDTDPTFMAALRARDPARGNRPADSAGLVAPPLLP
jgi:hypothetical protein